MTTAINYSLSILYDKIINRNNQHYVILPPSPPSPLFAKGREVTGLPKNGRNKRYVTNCLKRRGTPRKSAVIKERE